jgi:hypothetical protein
VAKTVEELRAEYATKEKILEVKDLVIKFSLRGTC